MLILLLSFMSIVLIFFCHAPTGKIYHQCTTTKNKIYICFPKNCFFQFCREQNWEFINWSLSFLYKYLKLQSNEICRVQKNGMLGKQLCISVIIFFFRFFFFEFNSDVCITLIRDSESCEIFFMDLYISNNDFFTCFLNAIFSIPSNY